METVILILKIDGLLTAFFFVVFCYLDFDPADFRGVDWLKRPNTRYFPEFVGNHIAHALLWPFTLCLAANKVLIIRRREKR